MEQLRLEFRVGDRVHHKDDPDGTEPGIERMESKVIGIIVNEKEIIYKVTGIEVDIKHKKLINGIRTVRAEDLTLIEEKDEQVETD